ncbi:MAG: orotidine-5'-phosphate decarboxylase [Clostridiales bacterium]|jgi:orotidine-5'-phosphate decarboxylase|nr:orotidine-5'-phosphate decarboxylase [Clostridiales bacterium]
MAELRIDELVYRARHLKNPTVVGLDPRVELLPECVFGGKKDVPRAIYEFNKAIIDAVADIVPAVKPQIAMYELYGSRGIEVFERTARYAKERGLIVIGDIKRGDIASTAEAYAQAHIGEVNAFGESFTVFNEDFATINPYLGEDSIRPFLDVCKQRGTGVFVLVKTSNPGSGQLQDIHMADGRPLYERVAELVNGWGKEFIGAQGYSSVGAVVGATHPAQTKRLRELMPQTLFLAPGYGAQGAKAEDIVSGSMVNSSRGIIFAYKNDRYLRSPDDFAKAARLAALDMRRDLKDIKI